MKKAILTVISLVLVVAMSVAGTLAFLKVKTTDVKNNLTSTDTNKPLSAKQGKVLKELIDTLTESVSGLAEEVSKINVIRDNESGDICFIDSDGYVIAKISA